MITAFKTDCFAEPITQIVTDVFSTMLNLEVSRSSSLSSPAPQSMTATIHFAGGWDGDLMLQCRAPEAVAFTTMLMPGLKTIADEDVADTLGELANMVGGNLKAILPPETVLSIPSVVPGTDFGFHRLDGGLTGTIPFTSDHGDFWITLVEACAKGKQHPSGE